MSSPPFTVTQILSRILSVPEHDLEMALQHSDPEHALGEQLEKAFFAKYSKKSPSPAVLNRLETVTKVNPVKKG